MTMTLTAVAIAATLQTAGAQPATPPPPAVQIAAAVQAAPPDRREGAAVLGYDARGALVELRAGTNDLVCVADHPATPAFEVVCYHKDLAPFFARGRELLAEGVTGRERDLRRWKEIEAGTLPMPREPRTSHILTGTGFDAAAGTVTEPFLRWVIYTPFATGESTGLPTTPAPGVPWLMSAGTAGAHIMITPPKP
jgi:hypothetical protein